MSYDMDAARALNDALRMKVALFKNLWPQVYMNVMQSLRHGWMEDVPTLDESQNFELLCWRDGVEKRNAQRAHAQALWVTTHGARFDRMVSALTRLRKRKAEEAQLRSGVRQKPHPQSIRQSPLSHEFPQQSLSQAVSQQASDILFWVLVYSTIKAFVMGTANGVGPSRVGPAWETILKVRATDKRSN
ncbi:hypothetical protein CYLTODRAFT_414502 [Cylindrobasidium torrendii FP15055 ss-10]|uniref:Uncharacterized protein n=1 Tax=Cylindrobasidium torrendii FP15055 ss-10 TaxID=1314674 RepID=A0A0D7AX33_9AGAR|nr:hypothetical protein CYLTODRAFT_414502 [Cylindrobasidium torrendii FP15055 ss-10]